MKNRQLIKIFKALSDPTRLEIVQYLQKEGECPCAIMLDHFQLAQPTMSHHFSKLIDAGVLIKEKKGTSNYYRINKDQLEAFGLHIEDLSN